MKKYPMTKKGLEKIKQRLHFLEETKRPEVDERIKRARGFCDFYEDVSFNEALEELSYVKREQKKLQEMIQHAEIIKASSTQGVALGSTVTIQEVSTGEKEVYTIVGEVESNPAQGKLSNQSPLANALLGKKVNDVVYVETPNGNVRINILDIQSLR